MARICGARGLLLAGCLLAMAGCKEPAVDKTPLPDPGSPTPEATGSAMPVMPVMPSPSSTVELDYGALEDHTDPERLLRFYASAIREGAWQAAALAWSEDANVSAEILEKAYGRGTERAELVFGKGDSEGAAGTVFHVAPIVVDFPDDSDEDERRGTIVLSRVNDVPGASAQQLDWRIQRSDVLDPANPARQ